MSDTGDQFYAAAYRRIYRNLGALAIIGAIAAAIWKGWLFGLGFLAGGLGALAIFGWFHYLGSALGGDGPARSKRALAWAAGMRYLLLGAVAYAMIKYLGISNVSFLLGLSILAPAVLIEILTELILYART